MVSSELSNDAAKSGSEEFFDPLTETEPDSELLPAILKTSTLLTKNYEILRGCEINHQRVSKEIQKHLSY